MSLFTVVTKNDSFQLPATRLIIGLGNNPIEYEKTRHNAGFMAVDTYVNKYGLANFASKPQLKADVSENLMEDTKVILAKPLTLMNRSGEAVFALQEYFQITIEDILVVHDDIDIDFGTLRVRLGGSDAGHNGLKSISQSIGEHFARIRLGIANSTSKKTDATDFVLKDFSRREQTQLPKILEAANDYIMKFVDNNLKKDSIRVDFYK